MALAGAGSRRRKASRKAAAKRGVQSEEARWTRAAHQGSQVRQEAWDSLRNNLRRASKFAKGGACDKAHKSLKIAHKATTWFAFQKDRSKAFDVFYRINDKIAKKCPY